MKTDEGMGHFAAMSASRKKKRGKFGAPTGKQMQVTDQSRVLPEDQVNGLIDAVLAGQDVEETIDATVQEIRESAGYGSGGPYPIGSTVKLNQPWAGMDIAGKPVSLSKGEVVSIMQTALGEHGTDKMILLPDGATRAIVPLKVLGESVEEGHSDGGYAGAGGDTTNPKKGPSGHKVPPATGAVGGMKHGKAQGDEPLPKGHPEVRGSGSASSHPSTPQGKGLPRDDPSAQPAGSRAPSLHPSMAVEDIAQAFNDMLDEAGDAITYRRISELARAVFDIDEPSLYAIVAEAIKEDSSIHLHDLEWLTMAEQENDDEFMKKLSNNQRKEFGKLSPSERKKYRKRYAYRCKYGEEEGMPAALRQQIEDMKEEGQIE